MRSNSRFIFAAAVLGALVVSSVALAAGGVVGTYKTTIRDSGHLNGKWAFELAKGGTYTVSMNGHALARGRYAATATTITFSRESGSGCSGAGVYAWKKSGKTMTFTRRRESASCHARASVLEHPFTQAR